MANFWKKISSFLSQDRYLPLWAGLGSGLYPMLFYYTTNFHFVNSLAHLFFFVSRFILLPTLGYYLLYFLFRKKQHLLYKKYILPFVNVIVFSTLVVYSVYLSFELTHILFIILCGIGVIIVSRFVKKLFPKILILQFLLVITTLYNVAVIVKKYIFYTDEWQKQPDNITETNFVKKPNVYLIQPDGYINFSELYGSMYNTDDCTFEQWLSDEGFKTYHNFRSNYSSTLSSNSSLFSMKHHYYDVLDERKVIANNHVIDIFNRNGYTTNLVLEKPYLLVNRPQLGYDTTNIAIDRLSLTQRGMQELRNSIDDTEFALNKPQNTNPNFYFIEKLLPGHISTTKNGSAEEEKENYMQRLPKANQWLTKLIKLINKKDPDALIVILADHGSFAGLEYTQQTRDAAYLKERNKVYSIFSSVLAIKWPENKIPKYDEELKTSVNLFRILFSYLSGNKNYLDALQPNESFLEINKNAPQGIYKVIDENGKVVLKRNEK